LEIIDAGQVVGDRDGRRDRREVEDAALGFVLRQVFGLHEAVGSGPIHHAVGEVGLALARSAAAVVDGHVRGFLGEAGDRGLVEGLRERCSRSVDRARQAREIGAFRGSSGAAGVGRVVIVVTAAGGDQERERGQHGEQHAPVLA
jgi:hypothetical protein